MPEGVDENKYFFLLTFLNQCYWVIGSVLGSLIGSLIPFHTAGIEFSMTALFLVVFVEQWKSVKNHSGALVVGLYLWKRNTLLSIMAGTVVYMVLIQCVF